MSRCLITAAGRERGHAEAEGGERGEMRRTGLGKAKREEEEEQQCKNIRMNKRNRKGAVAQQSRSRVEGWKQEDERKARTASKASLGERSGGKFRRTVHGGIGDCCPVTGDGEERGEGGGGGGEGGRSVAWNPISRLVNIRRART